MVGSAHPGSDNGRFASDATLDLAKCVSDYGLVTARLASAGYFEALQFASRLARSSNGEEIFKLSETQYRAQADIMREHSCSLFDLGREILVAAMRPYRTQIITACCVIL